MSTPDTHDERRMLTTFDGPPCGPPPPQLREYADEARRAYDAIRTAQGDLADGQAYTYVDDDPLICVRCVQREYGPESAAIVDLEFGLVVMTARQVDAHHPLAHALCEAGFTLQEVQQ